MHILIGIILILFLLIISKTFRALTFVGASIIFGVVVIGLVVAAVVKADDAISSIVLLLIVGAVLIVWVMISMGMHLGSVAGGSVHEYVGNRLQGKKHDESIKAAGAKAIDLLAEDVVRLDNSCWGSSGLPDVRQIKESQGIAESEKDTLAHTELDRYEVKSTDSELCCHTEEQNSKQDINRLWRVPGRRNAEVLDHRASPSEIEVLYSQYFRFSKKNGCCIECRQPLYIFQAKDFCALFDDLTPEWKAHSCDLKPVANRGEWQLFLPLVYPTGVIRGLLQFGGNQEELVINYETASPRYWPNHWCGQPMLASSQDGYYQLSTFVFIDNAIVPMTISGRLLTHINC